MNSMMSLRYANTRTQCLGFVFMVAITACDSSPSIRDARATVDHQIAGTVPAFLSTAENASDPVVLVLAHGVGDTCPGFGLDPTSGWLNDRVAATLGMTGKGKPTTPQLIYDGSNRTNGKIDPGSGVYLTRREFSFRRGDGSVIDVHAVEITWAGLTAWIKASQLADDLSTPVPAGTPAGQTGYISCPAIANDSYPFAREYANRIVKEGVLDMLLSDAVLYVGSYGVKIERSVAEVLCRAVSSQAYDSEQTCDWATVGTAAQHERFIFMTHSLGSRIIYDSLLELSGQPMRPGVEVFDPEYLKSTEPVAKDIIANTAAVYMFANQLPLLGLADLPITTRSDQPPMPSIAAQSVHDKAKAGALGNTTADRNSERCSRPLMCFAAAKSGLREFHRHAKETLDIVAFSDPNDLLSYSIPPWYVSDAGQFDVRITNVTLQVDTHWFGLFESPLGAHDDYFIRDNVWNVVRCGANDGVVSCQSHGM